MRLLIPLFAMVLLAFSSAAQAACRPSAKDSRQVETAVRGLYAALAAEDQTGVQGVTTTDFYAYDVGRRFNTAAELAAAIRQAHASGVILEWNLGPVDVHVTCDTAWAAWENDGRAGPKGTLQPMHWLESAVLVRDGGGWRIRFLHSTRAPPAK